MKRFTEMTEIEAAEHYGRIGASHALSRLGQQLQALSDDIIGGTDEMKAGFRCALKHVIEICETQGYAMVEHLPHAAETKEVNARVKALIEQEKENR